MLSVPAKNQPASLEEILQDQAAPNLRAVHRLDRVTEGLLLFSKTNFGHEALLNAFKRRLLDKRYLLITEGALPFKKKTVEEPLHKIQVVQNGQKFFRQQVEPNGQNASTLFRVWTGNEKASLVEARPFTGRMHQIRAHLAHLGYPIAGDALYGAQHAYPRGNIALCAYAVNCPPPKGPRASIVTRPSSDFLKTCRKVGIQFEEQFQKNKPST